MHIKNHLLFSPYHRKLSTKISKIAGAKAIFGPLLQSRCVKTTHSENIVFFEHLVFIWWVEKILYGKKGATNSFLSVDPGSAINTNYKLLKITNPASDISADYYIKALNIGITTSATIAKTVFIKKEQEGDQPKLCLYEKI